MNSVLERPMTLNSAVSIRPESFGAMAYHFGTRRLSFLKSRQLLAIVQALGEHPTAGDACRAAGVTPEQLPSYELALTTLADTDMIVERSAS
jgi:putative mycofactocin binding protein MftB